MKHKVDIGGYAGAVGRRKTATARVRISKVKQDFIVNGKEVEQYFPTKELVKIAISPFNENEMYKEFGVTVVVKGGGSSAQAQAIRHGLTRAFVIYNEQDRKMFKDLGFLRRDPRKKERKKFGLRKARKAPQWSKR